MSLIDALRKSAQFEPVKDEVLTPAPAPAPAPVLDAIDLEKEEARAEAYKDRAGETAYFSLRRQALDVLQVWAEGGDGDDDEDSEGAAENLEALLFGLVDEDGDKKLSKDEEEAVAVARAAVVDYLQNIGVDDDDIEALLDGDDDAAEGVRESVMDAVDDGDDDTFDKVAFGDYDEEDEEDEEESEVLDKAPVPARSPDVRQGRKASSVRKKFVSFKHGKRTVRWKRVAGRPSKRSAAQKAQLKAARILSKTGGAMKNWKRSMLARKKMGIASKKIA